VCFICGRSQPPVCLSCQTCTSIDPYLKTLNISDGKSFQQAVKITVMVRDNIHSLMDLHIYLASVIFKLVSGTRGLYSFCPNSPVPGNVSVANSFANHSFMQAKLESPQIYLYFAIV